MSPTEPLKLLGLLIKEFLSETKKRVDAIRDPQERVQEAMNIMTDCINPMRRKLEEAAEHYERIIVVSSAHTVFQEEFQEDMQPLTESDSVLEEALTRAIESCKRSRKTPKTPSNKAVEDVLVSAKEVYEHLKTQGEHIDHPLGMLFEPGNTKEAAREAVIKFTRSQI